MPGYRHLFEFNFNSCLLKFVNFWCVLNSSNHVATKPDRGGAYSFSPPIYKNILINQKTTLLIYFFKVLFRVYQKYNKNNLNFFIIIIFIIIQEFTLKKNVRKYFIIIIILGEERKKNSQLIIYIYVTNDPFYLF